MEPDLDDAHLCIKCSATIVGLENYIKHRKNGCSVGDQSSSSNEKVIQNSEENADVHHDTNVIASASRTNFDHTYDAFSYHEPEAPTSYVNKSQHGGKSTKSFSDAYELPYELGADVFFSSLQLQSVQSAVPSTSGKSGTSLAQNTSTPRHKHEQEGGKVGWITNHGTQRNSERLMKAFTEIGDIKPSYEHIFKPIHFAHDSPDLSEDDIEEDDVEESNDDNDDDDDEEYDSIAVATHGSGGKWKSSPLMRQSPPGVPASHTGGKWKPGNRLARITHTQLSCLSPTWEDQIDEVETPGTPEVQLQHPPADHTKGKWVPGTKMQRLEYKEVPTVTKTAKAKEDYWCNICCRRLKNRANYESHVKTGYHLKRAEPEQQLEKASLGQLKPTDLKKLFEAEATNRASTAPSTSKKRFRRSTFIRCDLCKHVMLRHLIGKHLISHYHYRRMHVNVGKSLRMILDNIHSIVLQSPYQCRPCRFYANTEEAFLWHWNSASHLDASEGAGKFFCSYCQYECEDNNQMRRHLLGSDHKEVILAINRSVPISISKKLSIYCNKCGQNFRYNAELRRHMKLSHPGEEIVGTASDVYQGRIKCNVCGECFRSKVSLQRHEKSKHKIFKFFCSICNLQFDTPCQARRHRKTLQHRKQAAITVQSIKKQQARYSGNSLKCRNCDFIAKSEVESVLHEFSHRKSDLSSAVQQGAPTKKGFAKIKKPKKRTLKTESSPMINCKDCSDVFDSKELLKKHRDVQHALLNHICPCCGKSFVTPQALGRHTRECRPSKNSRSLESPKPGRGNVEDQKKWNCSECDFSSLYESELLYHRLHHTHGPLSKTELIQCPLCKKQFRKYSLRCHLRQHTNEKIFECEFCKLKFSRHHNLKNHIIKLHHKPADSEADEHKHKTISSTGIKTEEQEGMNDEQNNVSVTKELRFSCDTCGKQFTAKQKLKRHQLSMHRIGEWNFLCTDAGCNYVGISKAALKMHITSHSKESFSCDHPKCKYVGKSNVHLLRHRRSHSAPEKLYKCDLCDFKARTQVHIRRHLSSHLNEKSHQCPYCEFKCITLDNLRKHILKTKKHPGKFVYECQRCLDSGGERDDQDIKVFKTNLFKDFQQHLESEHIDQC